MKKFYSILAMAAAVLSMSAQQLPNNGFEDSWSKAYPWTSVGTAVQIGENPSSWCISHVTGIYPTSGTMFRGTGKKAMGSKVEGYNSSSAVELKNAPTGALGITRTVPGYLTLGTTWSTAVATTKTDGGTFGGIEFNKRPDALNFMYKRTRSTDNSNELISVVLYMWKGSWSQANVPGNIVMAGDTKNVTMVDRDRNVLGLEPLSTTLGGEVTKSADAELIAKINLTADVETAEWKQMELPIEYLSDATPAKFNVIFAANDYFNPNAKIGENNTLTIDDVKLVYFSQLSDLKVNGKAVEGFSPEVYEYNMDGEMPADASAIAYTLKGTSNTAKATVDINAATGKVEIVVANPQGTDLNGDNTHVYTLQYTVKAPEFEAPENADVYEGTLVIEMMGSVLNEGDSNLYKVYTVPDAEGTHTFILPNFSIDLDGSGAQNMGNIEIKKVSKTREADGSVSITGHKDPLYLLGGALVASVALNGKEDTNGVTNMHINVGWKLDKDNVIPIEVTFNGAKIRSGVESVAVDNMAPVYYNMQGMRVDHPRQGGLYIERRGNSARKIVF